MRREFLRDVIAGSVGVLVVLAVIGLPKDPATTHSVQVQWQGTRLLPYYSSNLHSSGPDQRVARPPVPAPPTP